jgi:hypothetical protein
LLDIDSPIDFFSDGFEVIGIVVVKAHPILVAAEPQLEIRAWPVRYIRAADLQPAVGIPYLVENDILGRRVKKMRSE